VNAISCGQGRAGGGAHVLALSAHRGKLAGAADGCIVVCDGLTLFGAAVNAVRDQASRRLASSQFVRNTFSLRVCTYWGQMPKDIKPMYTAPIEAAAKGPARRVLDHVGQAVLHR
jgi:transposase-like protein